MALIESRHLGHVERVLNEPDTIKIGRENLLQYDANLQTVAVPLFTAPCHRSAKPSISSNVELMTMSTEPQHRKADFQVAIWLLICAAVIFGMIVLGGVTRLTGSGLSMVEWKPLMGVIPPLNQDQWQETFEKYQQFPEYQKVNHQMDLQGFKSIFIFEYAHRVLGRLIGVLFFFPFLYFLIRKKIPAGYVPKLSVLFVLGALQGLLGWYMVKSGLVDLPRVSQYRLTAHLGLAVVIYTLMMWLVFDLLFTNKDSSSPSSVNSSRNYDRYLTLKKYAYIITALIFLMILSGGLVSGLRAGFAYNTFPLMDGRIIPLGLYDLSPAWRSIFEDITTVQFNHRIFAYIIFVSILSFVFAVFRGQLSRRIRRAVLVMLTMLLIQVSLGISTLLLIVPVPLAAAHQAGAILLLSAALFVCHVFKVETSKS